MKSINEALVVCLKNDIKVYPIIHDINYLKIEVNYSGRKKKGKEIYNWRTQQKELQQKIIELYETLAGRIQSRE
jgi:hypothetical protein